MILKLVKLTFSLVERSVVDCFAQIPVVGEILVTTVEFAGNCIRIFLVILDTTVILFSGERYSCFFVCASGLPPDVHDC